MQENDVKRLCRQYHKWGDIYISYMQSTNSSQCTTSHKNTQWM